MVDRYDWRIFRRVCKVSLDGPHYTSDLLPHLATLRELRELTLINTSVSNDDVERWKQEHPRVVVNYTPRVVTR